MSFTSKLGREEADKLKLANKKSYQDHLFAIMGFKFKGEKYILNYPSKTEKKLVGIQNPSQRNTKWPMKNWNHYDILKNELTKKGYKVKFLDIRGRLSEHINDIASCEFVICEDSLPMHIALALNKPTITLFICTSPQEIYDYGLLRKIVSPKLKDYWYKRENNPEAAKTIKIDDILNEFEHDINNNTCI